MRIDPEHEQFNVDMGRRGGGYPVDDMERNRDCVSQMGMAEHRPDVLYNALRDMGVEVSDAVHTGARGPHVGLGCDFMLQECKLGDFLTTPWDSGCRRFVTRVPVHPQPISKPLQNLSAVALMCLGRGERRAEPLKDRTNKQNERQTK